MPTGDIYKTVPQGWQCPLCKVVHSPDVKECKCEEEYYPEVTKYSKTALEIMRHLGFYV